jgi:hypothetical protein
MRTRFGRKVLFSALLSIGLLLLVEGLLAVASLPSAGLYTGNLVTDWRLAPGLDVSAQHVEEANSFQVRTSADGFRDGEIPSERPWIAAVGCSTTFGWGVSVDEAWPEIVERTLGVEVINAGIPGHSSHQGRALAVEMIARKPTLLVLAWMVRDVQTAPIPDKQARAPKGLRTSRIFRLLAKKSRGDTPRQGKFQRVGPKDFESNYREVLRAAAEAEVPVVVLAFPMQAPSSAHLAVLRALGVPVVQPKIEAEHFFESDPIHLNSAGNLALAKVMVEPLRAALSSNEAAD